MLSVSKTKTFLNVAIRLILELYFLRGMTFEKLAQANALGNPVTKFQQRELHFGTDLKSRETSFRPSSTNKN